jgi:hypothetical protein
MIKSNVVIFISLLFSFFLLSNSIAYADINLIDNAYADGHGNGNGGNGHGQGNGNNNGHGQGHGNGHGNSGNNGHGNGHGNSGNNGHKTGHGKNNTAVNSAVFSKNDRTTISHFFHANPFPVSNLPPGIAMNVARGKPLPPGIQKVFLPSGLISQLPARPGFEYLQAGKDVLLVNSSTGVVSDILSNVLK